MMSRNSQSTSQFMLLCYLPMGTKIMKVVHTIQPGRLTKSYICDGNCPHNKMKSVPKTGGSLPQHIDSKWLCTHTHTHTHTRRQGR